MIPLRHSSFSREREKPLEPEQSKQAQQLGRSLRLRRGNRVTGAGVWWNFVMGR